MLRPRATLLALPWLLVGAFAFQQDDPAAPDVFTGAATALDADFERLEEAWSTACAEWLAEQVAAGTGAEQAAAEGDLGADGLLGSDVVLGPDADFARDFEDLAERGSGPAALWRLVHFRSALGLGLEEDVPADARGYLLDVYARLVDQHSNDVELLVPALFERLAAEHDLTDYEVDEICARLEMAGRHPEVQARSILVRAERAGPLGCENLLDRAIAGILLDRILSEYPTTAAYLEAIDARWRLDHLSVGLIPPAFETWDFAGNEIFLGDLNGYVRIVTFLGAEAGASEAGIARATERQGRYWDERFRWIGIHEHPDSEAFELLLQEPSVLGLHAYEGAGARPAVESWRIHRRPVTFLLDGQGRVRGVDLEGDALSERIRLLLDELGDEEEAAGSGASGGQSPTEPSGPPSGAPPSGGLPSGGPGLFEFAGPPLPETTGPK